MHQTDKDASLSVPEEKLSKKTILGYATGGIVIFVTPMIYSFYLNPFFLEVVGLNPFLSGMLLMFQNVVDAFTDPLIGYLSDKTPPPRRMPYIWFAFIPFSYFYFMTWVVPDMLFTTQGALFIYYAVVLFLKTLMLTCVNIPYSSLSAELTHSYDKRSILIAARWIMSLIFATLSTATQSIIVQYVSNLNGSDFKLGYAAAVKEPKSSSVLRDMMTSSSSSQQQSNKSYGTYSKHSSSSSSSSDDEDIDFKSTSSSTSSSSSYRFEEEDQKAKIFPYSNRQKIGKEGEGDEKISVWKAIKELASVFKNKPFVALLMMFVFSFIALNFVVSNLFLYVKYVLEAEDSYVIITTFVMVFASISIAFWGYLSLRIGKKIVFYIGATIMSVALVIAGFMTSSVPIIFIYILIGLGGFGLGVCYLIPSSMLPDVIEYDELVTGRRREGIFFSMFVDLIIDDDDDDD